jgi:aspartate aminotransferase
VTNGTARPGELDGSNPLEFTRFVESIEIERAFETLVRAKRQKAAGKDVVELQIGDSPFPSPPSAVAACVDAMAAGVTRYAPSVGLPEFRSAAADRLNREYDLSLTADNICVGAGAKIFQTYFCETFLEPGDEVLLFTPAFPTYRPNVERREAVVVESPLLSEQNYSIDFDSLASFLRRPKARAIVLNSPHNPTGAALSARDVERIAQAVSSTDVVIFSDEPYEHMSWLDRHRTILSAPGMIERTLAVYSFSKSYAMSGWRLGFAVGSPTTIERMMKLVNISLSCVPPFIQIGGIAAMNDDRSIRDSQMLAFRRKTELLADRLDRIDGIQASRPAGAFYVFGDVRAICERWGVTSHGLATYLLEGADDQFGVGCLGGECFGRVGMGRLRFSCAEADERLIRAVDFIERATSTNETPKSLKAMIERNPEFRLD